MKKRGVFLVLLISIIFFISFVASANDTTTTSTTNEKAYSCLNSLVSEKCSSLSTEEQIFSLLSIQACKSELIAGSLANQCWPSTGCKIKTTSQAILAMKSVNTDTSDAENWLLSQKISFPDIDWFLQAGTNENSTSCTATYSSGSYAFTINSDKSLKGSSNSCFSVYNNYWLKISSSCYGQEIKVVCQDDFWTSLLYKKKSSTTVYVSEKTPSAPGGGSTSEIVDSSCFKEGNSCTYEGTLWAALVLKYRGYDISSYLPYLISYADDNQKYVPYSFLYSLTNNYQVDLLAQQQQSKWWAASGDKFYDTAVALLPFSNQQPAEKTNSINWLTSVQGTDGCWQDNIRNTAFLLYSVWPKASTTSTTKDCVSTGYSCVTSASCTSMGGNVLDAYSGCFGVNKCCDKKPQLQSCSDQHGDICSSIESCLGGTTIPASDATGGKSCCVDGACGVQQQASSTECDSQGGICKSSCSSSEDSASYACGSTYACCIQKQSSGVSIVVIIILVILIGFVIAGIVFRKKLKEVFSKFGKGKAKPSSGPSGRFPPSSAQRSPVQRRILPQQQNRAPVRRPQARSDFDDVLKKLKEIGK